MPRVDITLTPRTKREARPRLSRESRSTSATSSVATPVKVEPVPIPNTNPSAPPLSPLSWRHPDELSYIRGGPEWDDATIVHFIVAHTVGVPPRSPSTMEPWVHVQCADGSVVALPRTYRLPFLWVRKFQRTSLALVLGAHSAIRQREWDAAKFEILHIARLCATLLDSARAAAKLERSWRCASFDRALQRYWYDWLIMRDEFVRDFWREFGEEEYKGDVLKLSWANWVLRGHKGFTLTKAEVADGISVAEFMKGFVVDDETRTFQWIEDSTPSPHVMETELPLIDPIPLPLSRIQSTAPVQVQQPTCPFEHEPAASQSPSASNSPTPRPAEEHSDVRMSVRSESVLGRRSSNARFVAEIHLEAAYNMAVDTLTKMASPPPGCTLFRGHPDMVGGILSRGESPESEQMHSRQGSLSEEEGSWSEQDQLESEDEDEDDKMEGIDAAPANDTVQPGELEDQLDLDDDDDEELQLMYPSSPENVRAPVSHTTVASRSPDIARRLPSNSPSRSSSTIPPISTARFFSSAPFLQPPKAHFPDEQVCQMTRSPRRALVEIAADPGMFTRATQMWSDEMRALRAEVGLLRAELQRVPSGRPHPSMDPELPQRRARTTDPLAMQSNAGWSHPLQHLIAGESKPAPMDVDLYPSGSGVFEGGAAAWTTQKYLREGDAEPLPPRSRKFSSTARFGARV
ncbi:hypothetical protein B0H17DRAFT_1194065 [Mycena rosella]|uniref:Uncharacterized protein n=1 Tax=Mycena rosella TaxID=1033263 RepID=A0AAD7GR77_MYCRO|nr:hypothetical protein B0H17DRAFT_1194065 [Mycena rosella]